MTAELPIRHLSEPDVPAWYDLLDLAFHERTAPDTRVRQRALIDPGRFPCAYDGDRMVGTAGAFPMRVSVPGGELGCAGVSCVAVLPTHRRRGLLTRLMAQVFADAAAAGEPLAMLWAAEGGIYERFGFGVAARQAVLRLDGGGEQPRDVDSAAFRPELLPLAGAGQLLDPVWEHARARHPGVPARSRQWWEEGVLDDPEEQRDGAREKRLVVVRDRAGLAQGYAIYRAKPTEPATTLEVLELAGADAEAEAAVWSFLCGIDLVGEIVAWSRPLDDPLPWRFADFDRVRVNEVEHALWIRLLDLPAAVAGRAWAASLDLVLEIADRRLPANAGTWRLEASADGAGRLTRAADAAPDLALDVSALGAAYLGGVTPARLADAGRIAERTPGALEQLGAALHVPRAPWPGEDF